MVNISIFRIVKFVIINIYMLYVMYMKIVYYSVK